MKFKNEQIKYQGRRLSYFLAEPDGLCKNANMFFMPVFPIDVAAKENMVRHFAEQLTAAGGKLICFEGAWQDLKQLALSIKNGRDAFREIEDTVNRMVSVYSGKNLCKQGKVVLIGESKFGFASLLAMASNAGIDAAAAVLPVTYWPVLREFEGMESNVLIRKYDLASKLNNFNGRNLLFEINPVDYRVRDDIAIKLAEAARMIYKQQGKQKKLTLNITKSSGHSTSEENVRHVLKWLKAKKYL